LRVQGLWFRGEGSGARVESLRFSFRDLGFLVQGRGLRIVCVDNVCEVSPAREKSLFSEFGKNKTDSELDWSHFSAESLQSLSSCCLIVANCNTEGNGAVDVRHTQRLQGHTRPGIILFYSERISVFCHFRDAAGSQLSPANEKLLFGESGTNKTVKAGFWS